VVKGISPADMAMGRGGRTLYVAVWAEPGSLIPVRTATLRRGRAIRLPEFPQQMIMSPDGLSVYVLGETGLVTRVSTSTGRVAWTVRSTAPDPGAIGVTPDGRKLYVLADTVRRVPGHLVPIGTATGTVGKRIRVGRDPIAVAFGPGGRTAYVLCSPTWVKGNDLEFGIGSVFPVTVATGQVGKPVLTGRGSLSLAVVPGRSYEPVGAGPLK
jgi:DNA-binding beta-propeller fold protein YncE